MSKISSEEYLATKLKPIFSSMTESLIRESPDEPVRSYNNILLGSLHDKMVK